MGHDVQETKRAPSSPVAQMLSHGHMLMLQMLPELQENSNITHTCQHTLSSSLLIPPCLLLSINDSIRGNEPKVDSQMPPQGKAGCLPEQSPNYQLVCSQLLSSSFAYNKGDYREDLDKPPTHLHNPGSSPMRWELQAVSLDCLQTCLQSGTWRSLSWCVHEHICVSICVCVYVWVSIHV